MARLRETLGRGGPARLVAGNASADNPREIAREGYVQRSKPIRADDLTRLVRSMLAESP